MKKIITGITCVTMVLISPAFAEDFIAQEATFKILVNGVVYETYPPAVVINGRTYLPLQDIGNALGVPVNWNSALGQVEIGKTPDKNALVLEAVKAVLPSMHKEHDTYFWQIDDNYYNVMEENDAAYMIEFSFAGNKEALEGLAAADPENYILYGMDYVPICIVEKVTNRILYNSGIQDYWEGMIDDLLYGDGTTGSTSWQ